jgi:hypothetical protein
MSRNIFSAALLAVMLVVLVAGNAQAQSASVNPSATVLAALTITRTADVSFGNIGATTGGAVYLNPQNVANSNYVGASATVGKFTIAGATATDVQIAWPTTITLSDGATPTPHTIVYTLKVTGSVLTASQATSTDLTSTNPATVTTAAGGDPTPGAYFLWVGGSLPQLSGQTTGTYNGTGNITVEYN